MSERPEHYEVTVYTQDNCGPCNATKAYLGKYEISYSEINLTRNPLVRDYIVDKGYQQAPVIEWTVNGQSGSWTGHEPENLEALKYLVHGE